jgi:glycosyltransferase involved in cell wall biosynthesis
MLKVATFGGRCITSQIQRIEEGFVNSGHEIASIEQADFLYFNDLGSFNESYLENKKPIILNILDIPLHCPEWKDVVDRIKKLSKTTFLTCISKTVKQQIKTLCECDVEVIYNPIKDVYYINKEVSFDFLYAGRANDPNKRFFISRQLIMSLKEHFGYNASLKVIGGENPNFGEYLGCVSDEELNDLYNSCKCVLLTSKFEGIGLSMIEALVCNKLPITCSDNPTAHEFLPEELICSPETTYKVLFEYLFENPKIRKTIKDLGLEYAQKFHKNNIAKSIINIYNSL